MQQKEPLLKVSEAFQQDVGYGRARIDNQTRVELDLSIGDVIYARVSVANKDLDPELVCFDTENRTEGFGEITDGMLYHCSCSLAKRYATMSIILMN